MEVSTIQSACNLFFEKNDFPDLCQIMYQQRIKTYFLLLHWDW